MISANNILVIEVIELEARMVLKRAGHVDTILSTLLGIRGEYMIRYSSNRYLDFEVFITHLC